jgi:hypothetical protein
MEGKRKVIVEDYTDLFDHIPTRPLKYFKDEDGFGWLCDKRVDANRDLREQGCWRCDEMAFPTGGR